MTNLLKFPNMRRIREVATLWISRVDRELSDQELQELKQWLSESPKHREAFFEAARFWDQMDVLTKLSNLFPLENFEVAPSRPPQWKWLSAAAAALAFLAIFLLRPEAASLRLPTLTTLTTAATSTLATIPAVQTYRTVVGQQSLVSLSDGTRIRLNTNSLIEVSYRPKSRLVHLVRGEALFEVAKDASRPFDVRSGGHIVRAVGTAFNVRVSGVADMEVTVTKGRIRILRILGDDAQNVVPDDPTSSSGVASPTAVAGQFVKVTSSGQSRVRELAGEELDDRTAWERGVLVFRGQPLREVLSEFARYTDQKFVPSDDSIGDIPVGGFYRSADVDGLLMALRENFGLQTTLIGDTVMIARKTDVEGRL